MDEVSFEPSCECELSLGRGEARGEGEGDLLDSILESLICSKISTSFACGDFNSRKVNITKAGISTCCELGYKNHICYGVGFL